MVCDRDKARARAARPADRGAWRVTDWREAVKADVDAVIVATTHDQLAGICARRRSKPASHVLVEKPAGRNVAEVQAVAAAAAKHSRIVKTGFNHRFHPASRRRASIVDSRARSGR